MAVEIRGLPTPERRSIDFGPTLNDAREFLDDLRRGALSSHSSSSSSSLPLITDRPLTGPVPRAKAPDHIVRVRGVAKTASTRQGVTGLEWVPLQERHGTFDWVNKAEESQKLRELALGWAAKYQEASRETRSPLVAAELILKQVQAATVGLGTPNPVLTAVGCMLLDAVTMQCGGYRGLAEKARDVIVKALYMKDGAVEQMLGDTADLGTLSSEEAVTCRDLIRKYRREQLLHVEHQKSLEYHSLLHPGSEAFLACYLRRMPCFEEYHRTKRQFEDFHAKASKVTESLHRQSKILSLGCWKWQEMLLRLVLRAWHQTLEREDRKLRCLESKLRRWRNHRVLHRHLSAWSVVCREASSKRKQLEGKRRMEELLVLGEQHHRAIKCGEEALEALKAKLSRATEEHRDALLEKQADQEVLQTATTRIKGWEGLVNGALGFITRLLGSTKKRVDDAEERRAAEQVLLVWANGMLECRGLSAEDFSESWKDGSLLLLLVQDLVKDTTQYPRTLPGRLHLVGQLLTRMGIVVKTSLIADGASDVIIVILYHLWHRFGHLPLPRKMPSFEGTTRLGSRIRSGTSSKRERSIEPNDAVSMVMMARRDHLKEAEEEMQLNTNSTDHWIRNRHILNHFCTTLMIRRCHEIPMTILTTREVTSLAKSIGSFSNFNRSHFVPHVLSEHELPQSEMDALILLVTKFFTDLSMVFAKYSNKGYMNYSRYFQFLSDTRILGVVKKQVASRIYAKVNYLNDSKTDGQIREATSAAPTDVGLTFFVTTNTQGGAARMAFKTEEVVNLDKKLVASEFSQILVHLAVAKAKEEKKFKSRRVSALTEQLILSDILPALASSSPVKTFRQQLWADNVQSAIDLNRRDLMWVFRCYAAKDMNEKKGGGKQPSTVDPNTLSLSEWLMMLEETGQFDEGFTVADATTIFEKLQDADGSTDVFVYCEFEDAVCCIALYKNPSPYVPLHIKITRYLLTFVNVVHRLQQKIEPVLVQEALGHSMKRRLASTVRSSKQRSTSFAPL